MHWALLFFKKIKKTIDKTGFREYNITRLAEANRSFFIERDKMTLYNALEGSEYIVDSIDTGDEDLEAFLFSLGCYSGEHITVIAHRRSGLTVSIKDGRYHIDPDLAASISIR